MFRFDATLRDRWLPAGDDWTFEMPDGWMQGRSVFGGLTVAAAASLGIRQVDERRSLRTFNAQLLSPVVAGPLSGSVRTLREGKNVSFVETRLSQAQREVAVVNLVFGAPRAQALAISSERHTSTADPETLMELPFLDGVTPEFTKQVAFRWSHGGLPFTGADEPKISGYCRFRVPSGDVEGLIGLLDAWPCPSLPLLKSPKPASTVMWTAHLTAVPSSFEGWFAFDYETVKGAEGFHTAVGKLYSPEGALVGFTEQLVALFG